MRTFKIAITMIILGLFGFTGPYVVYFMGTGGLEYAKSLGHAAAWSYFFLIAGLVIGYALHKDWD